LGTTKIGHLGVLSVVKQPAGTSVAKRVLSSMIHTLLVRKRIGRAKESYKEHCLIRADILAPERSGEPLTLRVHIAFVEVRGLLAARQPQLDIFLDKALKVANYLVARFPCSVALIDGLEIDNIAKPTAFPYDAKAGSGLWI
jgi:hypothetical protein